MRRKRIYNRKPDSVFNLNTTETDRRRSQSISADMADDFGGYPCPPAKRAVFGQVKASTSIHKSPAFPKSLPDHRDKLKDLINHEFRVTDELEKTPTRVKSYNLPGLVGGESEDVWTKMCLKDDLYKRNISLFHSNPLITKQMRMILLDWLAEVCECQSMHRETFYLAVDLVDRYLSSTTGMQTNMLQLTGVTALFIASKIEEIYPPKIERFAYVTKGACNGEEIRMLELVMLKSLNWALSPITCIHWLTTYLQMLSDSPQFEVSHFERLDFISLARMLDLCLMDSGSLNFKYSTIAAALLYSSYDSKEFILSVTGFKHCELLSCCEWMSVILSVSAQLEPANLTHFDEIAMHDWHNIQTHVSYVQDIFMEIEKNRTVLMSFSMYKSPDIAHRKAMLAIYPTPPPSDERPGPKRPPHTIG